MVAPKRRWIESMGTAVRRQHEENQRFRAALLAIVQQHERLPVLYQDFGVCAVCDGALDWPCPTAKAALEALDHVGVFE